MGNYIWMASFNACVINVIHGPKLKVIINFCL